jgi:hypothetical protein
MPAASVDRDELLRETRRVAQGEDVGAALADPVIVVDARGLTVNGTNLLLSQPLTVPITETKRLMRIDEEFNVSVRRVAFLTPGPCSRRSPARRPGWIGRRERRGRSAWSAGGTAG